MKENERVDIGPLSRFFADDHRRLEAIFDSASERPTRPRQTCACWPA